MFTRREMPPLATDELPVLYVPGMGNLHVEIVSLSEEFDDAGDDLRRQTFCPSISWHAATLYSS